MTLLTKYSKYEKYIINQPLYLHMKNPLKHKIHPHIIVVKQSIKYKWIIFIF